jgi:hypothetical protein
MTRQIRSATTLIITALAGLLIGGPALATPYDGVWQVFRTSGECAHKEKAFSITIANGRISGPRHGQVNSIGQFNMAFKNPVKHYTYSGQLGARTGSGTWQRQMFNGNANCSGALELRRAD